MKQLGPNASEALIKSKGNRLSTSIMFPFLTPAMLGGWLFFFPFC